MEMDQERERRMSEQRSTYKRYENDKDFGMSERERKWREYEQMESI